MGARGPRGELPAIKKAKGNPGKRPVKDSGVVATGAPFVLEYLSDYARGVVETVIRSLPPGTYSATDSFDLGAFAVEVEKHRAATLMIAAEGYVTKGSTGQLVASPWVRIQTDAASKIASLGDRLGLDPKSRAGLGVKADEKPTSKFDGLLGGHPN